MRLEGKYGMHLDPIMLGQEPSNYRPHKIRPLPDTRNNPILQSVEQPIISEPSHRSLLQGTPNRIFENNMSKDYLNSLTNVELNI
jgi:hypothetical protein